MVIDWSEGAVECSAGKGGGLWKEDVRENLWLAFSLCAADLHWWQFFPGRPKTSCHGLGGLGHKVGPNL